MSWSVPIIRIAGIQLRIHITFLLLIAWLGLGYYAQGGSAAAVSGILVIVLLFVCVVLHEFGHAFAAKAFGINTPDITLLPIGGVARLERMPEEPIQELIIAAAGPAVNLIIALCLFLTGGSFVYPPTAGSHRLLIPPFQFAFANIREELGMTSLNANTDARVSRIFVAK